jgi:hypothetical protein
MGPIAVAVAIGLVAAALSLLPDAPDSPRKLGSALPSGLYVPTWIPAGMDIQAMVREGQSFESQLVREPYEHAMWGVVVPGGPPETTFDVLIENDPSVRVYQYPPPTGWKSVQVAGRPAMVGSFDPVPEPDETLYVIVSDGDAEWTIRSTNVSRAELLRFAANLEPRPRSIVARYLPPRIRLISRAALKRKSEILTTYWFVLVGRKGDFRVIDVSGSIGGFVSPDDASSYSPYEHRSRVRGHSATVTSGVLEWNERPDVSINVFGTGVSDADARRIAESLREVTQNEWDKMARASVG